MRLGLWQVHSVVQYLLTIMGGYMLKLLLLTGTLVACAIASAQVDVQSLRASNQVLLEQSSALVGSCADVKAAALGLNRRIDEFKSDIGDLNAAREVTIQKSLNYLDLAQQAIELSTIYCVNGGGYTDGKKLYEMYLINIDTELMIFQYGVGEDLNKNK